MRFIDSNILAYAFYQNTRQEACQNAIKQGGITDTFTLAEAFNIIQSETDQNNAVRAIRGLLKSNLTILNTDVNAIYETTKRAEKHKNLKFIDLLHYTLAALNTCTSILSYDKDFDRLDLPREEP